MTHNDIYIKFMIEYDKAGASTSYPSLTEYEVATFLDKAYNALIAQKITGNNYRRSTFESDIKAIADLGPLVDTKILEGTPDKSIAPNIFKFDSSKYPYTMTVEEIEEFVNDNPSKVLPRPFGGIRSIGTPHAYHYGTIGGRPVWSTVANKYVMEYANSYHDVQEGTELYESSENVADQDILDLLNFGSPISGTPFQSKEGIYLYDDQEKMLYITTSDAPLIINIVDKDTNLLYFLQGSMLYSGTGNTGYGEHHPGYNPIDKDEEDGPEYRGVPVKLVDHNTAQKFFASTTNIPWIKTPVCFIEGKYIYVVYDRLDAPLSKMRVTFIKRPNTFVKDSIPTEKGAETYFDDGGNNLPEYQFECNSTVAEELVSLAVSFALENVESSRLNAKLNMRGLEA